MIGTCAAPDGEQTITTGKTRRGRRDEITRVAESTTRSRLITEQRVLPLKQESNAADNPRAAEIEFKRVAFCESGSAAC